MQGTSWFEVVFIVVVMMLMMVVVLMMLMICCSKVGLIYVNPGGPQNNAECLSGSARNIRSPNKSFEIFLKNLKKFFHIEVSGTSLVAWV